MSYQPRFDWTLDDAVAEARAIIETMIETRKPKKVFAWVSGGHDSIVALDIAQPYIDGVLHTDTTVGVWQTRRFVESECARRGLELYVRSPRKSYSEQVRMRGFYAPKDHPYAYRLLKKDTVRTFRWEWLKPREKDTIMLLTGMRSPESRIRMAHGAGHRLEDRVWWVNPIRHFSKDERDEYIRVHKLPENPIYKVLGKSGECNCGCFAAGPIDKEVLRGVDPGLVARIEADEAYLESIGHRQCKWGRNPQIEIRHVLGNIGNPQRRDFLVGHRRVLVLRGHGVMRSAGSDPVGAVLPGWVADDGLVFH